VNVYKKIRVLFTGFIWSSVQANYLAFLQAFLTKQIWSYLSPLRCLWTGKIRYCACLYHQFCWPSQKTVLTKYEFEFGPKCQLLGVHCILQFCEC
jgi:hypothetical protein